MLKITILSCPNCDCVWDQEEIDEGICGACGYPNHEDDREDEDDDIIIGYHCLGCGNDQNTSETCDRCTGSALEAIYF